jgi:hypothetical protein
MLNHTTAKGLQEEVVRRARRPMGSQSDLELNVVTVNWRRIWATVAAAMAVIAIVAATAMGPAGLPVEQTPAVETGELQGGTSGVVLKAE